jgi:hypothetical protein
VNLAKSRRLPAGACRAALFACITAWLAAATATAAPPAPEFTIAVVPDTQYYVDFKHQTAAGFPFDASALFLGQMQFIADHARSAGGDIAFVSALGDLWEHQPLAIAPAYAARGFRPVASPRIPNQPTDKVASVEIPMVRRGYELISGKLPFSVVPGNHDYDAMWTDVSHPPVGTYDPKDRATLGVAVAGGLDTFRSVFSDQSPFFKGKSWYVASHDGGADSAQIFAAGGYRFLHIGIEFDPPDASLEWAASIIRRYPGLPTIITTHDYLSNDGRRVPSPTTDTHAVDPTRNNPQMIWDKLIRQHDQIFLVLCGHQAGQAMRVDDNEAGHKVYQVLSDYQERGETQIVANIANRGAWGVGDGWLRLMTFDMGAPAPSLHVRTYSTYYKAYSTELPSYAQWYRPHEKPAQSDVDYLAQDDFTISLTDFRKRFGPGSPGLQ